MYYDNSTKIYLDGDWVFAKDAKTGLYSQTLHYGNGVFEGIRAYKTEKGVSIFKAKEHFERLVYSADKMQIQLPYTVDEMIDISYELLKKNNLEDAYIRPLVFLEPNMSLVTPEKSHFMISAWKWGKLLGDKQLHIMFSSFQRPNPKSCFVEAKVVGHYTNSILAANEAKRKGYDEALLADCEGYIAEGPGANFFYEKDKELFTAPLGNILNGITRQTIFELAKDFNIKITEKKFTKEEVYQADGAFFTGTAAEVAPIKSLDDHSFKKDWKDTLGYKLQTAYTDLVLQKK